MSMDIQPKRYIANELKLNPTILKELANNRKKQVWGIGDKLNTLIIDYGSQNIKAGYDWSSDGPDLIFRPQISKNRDINRTDLPIKAYINTSYDQLDLSKINYKSPYERNLILHFSLMQQCNDYIFGQIYRPNKRIRNPVIITEPFANPQHCRGSLLQQFFECYEIDSVMVGIDCLFAYFYEVGCSISRYESQTALIINMGATTVHIAAIIAGKVDYNSIRRINIGGNTSFELFGKSLLLKNPQLKDKLTYSFLRDIYERFTSIAIDYREQLKYFQRNFKKGPNKSIYHNRIQQLNKQIDQELKFVDGIQIDFDIIIEIPQQQIKRKEQVRKRMSEKLKQTLNRRKQMKLKLHQMQLKNLIDLKERYQAHDKFAHEQVVQIFGQHKPHQKLEKKIKTLEIKLGLAEEKTDEGKFNLINIPDHQLPPEKIKYKKLQIYQKQALQHRKQKQQEKELQENRMKQLRQSNPQLYLTQLKQKYKAQYAKIKENQRIKSELNNRKSKLKQRKMQVIARLSQQDFDPDQQQGEDDWLAYKDLQESDHYSQIEAMEAELRQIDPQWTQAKDHHHLKQTNQLFLYTDLLKCHEIYFQPLMINNNQMDLIQTIISMLSAYNSDLIKKLLKNIVVVGGGSVIAGLKQRLTRDLIREGPCNSQVNIKIGKGGAKGAFLGMQYIGKHERQFLQKMSYKRQDYLSKNGNIFVENPWSNPRPHK